MAQTSQVIAKAIIGQSLKPEGKAPLLKTPVTFVIKHRGITIILN